MRKLLSFILSLMLLLTLAVPSVMAEAALSEDVVILYTNDVHTYINNDDISYDVVAGVKAELEKQYEYVLLVDAGDHAQGTAFGSMDCGETIIKLMNAAEYDVATIGNHEFDYGTDGMFQLVEWAEYPYISCNFYHEENYVRNGNVLDAYVTFLCGDTSVAFVGITTPETYTKSSPANFQNENGEFIYGIAGGEDGSKLYADVQDAVNEVKNTGVSKVIALGHLGVDESSKPWTSEEVIANVSGLDAFIDGHSHSSVESKEVTDKDGKAVILTQTGEYLGAIGMMVIDAETGAITTDMITAEAVVEIGTDEEGNEVENVVGYKLVSDLYTGAEWPVDEDVAAIKNAWIAEIDGELGVKVGTANVIFDNYDEEGKRLVRKQETNSGNFAADALYYLFDNMGLEVDFSIMNGGGVRNKAVTGELSYLTLKNIHTFGNVACLQTITGQQLLDALEWGARGAGTGEEIGGFLHTSGLTYKIATNYPSTLVMDEEIGLWLAGPTAGYRVHDVKVYNKETGAWDDLDLNATYKLAGYNYTLRDLGDGFNMFDGAVNVLDYVMEDYMVLANYVSGFEGGIVEATNSPLAAKYPNFKVDYSTVNGAGRIELVTVE